ncbi:MAG TPA: peptidylprolyl isomerase [Methylophilaceae bacterium]|nr:peptidylprolyl isomerase [Methylophilaceae bacterium]
MSPMSLISLLKRFTPALLLTLAGVSQLAQAKVADILEGDRIVAVVNQGVITENELQNHVRLVSEQLSKKGTQLPPKDVLEKQILERLIVDQLQLQLAAETGLRVDDNQLDKTIQRIAEQNKLTMPEFQKTLAQQNISYSKFREDIRNEIIIARLREREIDNRINVSEAEIDNYLLTQSSQQNVQDEFDVEHILIRAPEEGSPEELQKLRAKAEKALKELQNGTPFAQVSASYSDAPNALEGGDLGWKNTGQLPSLFVDALKPLQVGQLTPILRSSNGFHILRLKDRRGASSPLVIEQTHARHILIKLSEVVSEDEAKRKINMIKERLDHGADFVELARQYSEDASAPNGGDLGWVNPGDTVPQFEEVMNGLKPGEISAPVKTQFGWHIIQVLDRRKQDMTREAARFKAREEIRSRKADEAYPDWIRELRDRAYVDLRLEDNY